jgi:hypothetical protein
MPGLKVGALGAAGRISFSNCLIRKGLTATIRWVGLIRISISPDSLPMTSWDHGSWMRLIPLGSQPGAALNTPGASTSPGSSVL